MRRISTFVLVVAFGASACSNSPGPPVTHSPAPSSTISVGGTWASGAGPHTAYVYFILDNQGSADDVLLGATSPIADGAIVRQASANGIMRPIDQLTIPAGGEVSFGPGEYDVELVGLSPPPRSGSVVRLVLEFEKAGPVHVTAGVR